VNIAELGAAVMLPVRTLVALDAARSAPPAIGRLAAVGSATACVAAAVAAGNVVRARGGRDAARALALVVCAAAASFFPVALLFHVGELYAHTALFWFAVLAAFAVDGLWIALRRARAAVLVCAAAYLVGIAAGQRANLSEMRATGERARAWLARIDDRLRPVPDGGFVLIAASGEYKAPFDYGLYRVTTPQVLVLTGLSPYPVRAAMRDRVAVYLDFADPGLWRAALERAGARGAYRLEIAGGDARLSRWLAAEVAAGR
jgi:hypothetical protein